jgi:hypothetical protein
VNRVDRFGNPWRCTEGFGWCCSILNCGRCESAKAGAWWLGMLGFALAAPAAVEWSALRADRTGSPRKGSNGNMSKGSPAAVRLAAWLRSGDL